MADPITIAVGDVRAAKVEVLDQNGAVMAYDFVANPPSFATDSPAVTLGPGATPDVNAMTGANAGTANVSVTVPGVANPTDTAVVTVTGGTETPVATSVRLSFA
jgi:hypothetical protein